MKIFVSDVLPDVVVEKLKDDGKNEVLFETGKSEDEIIKIIADFDAVIVRSATQITAKIIEAGKNLKVIGRAGAGTDNIDKIAAKKKGITVVNAPTGNLISVAELVVGYFVALSRHIVEATNFLRNGSWEKKSIGKKSHEINGSTIGIIGFGKIGQLVAERIASFGTDILVSDPVISEEVVSSYGCKLVSLDKLLAKSDFITIHVPRLPATENMISKDEFTKMKDGAVFVNCSRGGIVDEKATYDALASKKLRGAAFDVFADEPVSENCPLLEFENFIATPHLGASTIEAQEKVGFQLVEQVFKVLKGKNADFIVSS